MKERSPTTLLAVGLIQAWILTIFIGCPILGVYLVASGKKGYLQRIADDPTQTTDQRELARLKLRSLNH